MDNLRIVLIVVALLVIIALLIHGFLINKREGASLFSGNKVTNREKQKSAPNLNIYDTDDCGIIGDVRVISSTKKQNIINNKPHYNSCENVELTLTPENPEQHDLFENSRIKESIEPVKIANSDTVVKVDGDNKNHSTDFTHSKQVSSNSENMEIIKDKTIEKSTITDSITPEKEQITTQNKIAQEDPIDETKAPQKPENDILILYVTGINGQLLQGDLLLNSIMQSGFQFGDMKMFHRHVDPAGNGPILFSLANMLKPGYLDPEMMHEFTTQGISLFMVVPAKGNNQQNFKLMLQTAQRIADDVNGVVLDDSQHMLTPQKIDSYKMRIKKVCQEV
ncbi:cell division protein ZipA [Orbaceae bacterium ESL0721]|nr:cell division protein ZipA [Orbaceae bacterium ESL0721]